MLGYVVLKRTYPGLEVVAFAENLAEAKALANLAEARNKDKGETDFTVHELDSHVLHTGLSHE